MVIPLAMYLAKSCRGGYLHPPANVCMVALLRADANIGPYTKVPSVEKSHRLGEGIPIFIFYVFVNICFVTH